MKLTTKQIMLLLMSTLLVLVIVMGSIVLNRVSGFLAILSGPGSTTAATDPTPSGSDVTEPSGTEPSSQPTVTTEPTEPHVHNYVKTKTVSATCTDFGYTIYACSCGKQNDLDMIEPKGHILGAATVVPRTCEQDGYTEQMCSRCNQPVRTNVEQAKHSFGSWSTASVLVGNPATQEQRTCSICDCIEIRNTATPDALAIRRYPSEAYGSYTTYKIVADLPDRGGAANEYSYQIYSQLENQVIHYNFSNKGSNKGLTLTYFVGSMQKTYTAPVKNNTVITINSAGNVTLKAPEKDEIPTTPSVPSPEPSQPGTDPTTPTGSTGTSPTTGSAPTESTGAPTAGTTSTEGVTP